MYTNNDFIYEATVQLEQLTQVPTQFNSKRKEYDAIITIKDVAFAVEAKAEVRASNKGIVLSDLDKLRGKTKRPILLVARFIAQDLALELRSKGINYLDVAGNAFIREGDLYIFITGQKVQRLTKTNQTRAFQEAGIKLIFHLLNNTDNLQLSYRELAELSDVAIGSISNVMKELEEQNFILKTQSKRVLKNKSELLNRWIIAYNDVLRPKILKKRMRFSTDEQLKNWNHLPIQDVEDMNLWGGEPAAAILTGQLQPEKFYIYTNSNWQVVANEFKLIPDENGEIEIYHMFWREEDKLREKYITPTLLIYADLISSGYDSNIQIANQILDSELSIINR